MADGPMQGLRGRRLLVVEDDYMIADEMTFMLEEMGVEVVGPVGSVEDALERVEEERHLDGAILDINLHDRRVYPVADALAARGVPFIFATGYDALVIPGAYAAVPRCEKPVERTVLARLLAGAGLGKGPA